MKRILTIMMVLALGAAMICGCGKVDGGSKDAGGKESENADAGGAGSVEKEEFDLDSLETIGDALALDGEDVQTAIYDENFVYVFGLEGTYYRVIADTSKEEHEKLNKLDILDDDYDKQLAEAVSPLKITQREDLTDRILTQEEMDALVGKTGKELIEEGWESTGYNLEDMEFYLGHDCFYYTVTFDYDGPKMENTDDFDEYAAIEPLKVKKVEYMGLGDACNLE